MSEQEICLSVPLRKLERMLDIVDKAQDKKVSFDENIDTMRKQLVQNMGDYLMLLRREIQECLK
jgi:hypothetical protein